MPDVGGDLSHYSGSPMGNANSRPELHDLELQSANPILPDPHVYDPRRSNGSAAETLPSWHPDRYPLDEPARKLDPARLESRRSSSGYLSPRAARRRPDEEDRSSIGSSFQPMQNPAPQASYFLDLSRHSHPEQSPSHGSDLAQSAPGMHHPLLTDGLHYGSKTWRPQSDTESHGQARRQSSTSDLAKSYSQDGNVRAETVNHKGVANVPTGPRTAPGISSPTASRANYDAPHIFISTASWDARVTPDFCQHLQRMLKKASPIRVELLKSGFYLPFEDSTTGRDKLQSCYEQYNGDKLFRMHTLAMEPYPFGWNTRGSLHEDANITGARRYWTPVNERQSTAEPLSGAPGQAQHGSERVQAARDVSRSYENQRPSLPAIVQRHENGEPQATSGDMLNIPHAAGHPPRQDTDDAASSVSGITGRSDGSSSKRASCHACKSGSPELVACSCGRKYHRRCHRPTIPDRMNEGWRCRRCEKRLEASKAPKRDERRSGLSTTTLAHEFTKPTPRTESATHAPSLYAAGNNGVATRRETASSEMLPMTPYARDGSFRSSPDAGSRGFYGDRLRQNEHREDSEEYDPTLEYYDNQSLGHSTGATPEPPRLHEDRLPGHAAYRMRKMNSEQPSRSSPNGAAKTSMATNTSSSLPSPRPLPPVERHGVSLSNGKREIPESPFESATVGDLDLRSSINRKSGVSEFDDHFAICAGCGDQMPRGSKHSLCSLCKSVHDEQVGGGVVDETTIASTQDTVNQRIAGQEASQRSTRSADPRLVKRTAGSHVRNTRNPNSEGPVEGSNPAPGSPATSNRSESKGRGNKSTAASDQQHPDSHRPERMVDKREPLAEADDVANNSRSPSNLPTPRKRPYRRRKRTIGEDSDEDESTNLARDTSDLQREANQDEGDGNDVPSDSALSSVADVSEIMDPAREVQKVVQPSKKRKRTLGTSQIRDAVDEFDLGDWLERPKGTYVKLICMALHAKPDHTLTPKEAVQWISENIPNYPTTKGDWTKNIGATLASRRVGSEPQGKKGLWRRHPAEPVNSTETVWYILLPDAVDEVPRWDRNAKRPFFPVGPETPVKPTKRSDLGTPGSKRARKKKPGDGLFPSLERRASGRTRRKTLSDARVYDSGDDELDGTEPPKSMIARQIEDAEALENGEVGSPASHAYRSKRRPTAGEAAADEFGAASGAGIKDDSMEQDARENHAYRKLSNTSAAIANQLANELNMSANQRPLVKRDMKELAREIREDSMKMECKQTDFFAAWPEYAISDADIEKKIAEIKKRPNWKARKGLPSVMDDWIRKPLLPSAPKVRSTRSALQTSRWDDTEGNVTHFETSEEFFDLPNQPEPFLHDKELAWRDGTLKADGKVRRGVIYRVGYAP